MKQGLLILCCIISFAAKAQIKPITLKGYIAVEGGESFTYKLVFTDSAGTIKGYSLIYQDEIKDVKSDVVGNIDRKAKTLSIKETSIVYNHGFESNAIMCLVSAQLKYAYSNNAYTLAGPLTSSDATNTYCGTGTITFMADDALKALFASNDKKDTVVPVKKASTDNIYRTRPASRPIVNNNYQPPKQESTNPPDEITTGVDKVYEWHSDTVVAEIWDGGNIDGDIITVLYNGIPILKHYTLTKEKKQLRISLSAKTTDVLTIVAINEGNEPPNTANILLIDGDKQYNIVAYNSMGQEATIKIKKAGAK